MRMLTLGIFSIGFVIIMAAASRPDCNKEYIVQNVVRVCKSGYIKRSTQGGSRNDLQALWPQMRSSYEYNNNRLFLPVRSDYERVTNPFPPQWTPYPPKPMRDERIYPEMPLPYAPYSNNDKGFDMGEGTEDWDNSEFEDLFNPVFFAGDGDVEITVERWRRNERMKEMIHRFIDEKCCTRGCSFPHDYLEFDRRTNICNLR